MKNKKIQRLTCFLLALAFCFTLGIAQPMQAHAAVLELGWVTWALISYLTACGISFAVVGGIQALQQEVEDKVDTYYEVTGIDLYQLIAQSLRLKPSNNNNDNGFWFGVSAVVAISEFIEWVTSNGWTKGAAAETEVAYYVGSVYVDGVEKIVKYTENDGGYIAKNGNYYHYYAKNLDFIVDLSPRPWSEGDFVFNIDKLYVLSYLDNKQQFMRLYNKLSKNQLSIYGVPSASGDLWFETEFCPYSKDEILGVTVVKLDWTETLYFALVFNDGTFISLCNFYKSADFGPISQNATISVPTEVESFDVDENQSVEIIVPVFNTETFENPEQLSEAVKQEIIETGTVPTITTQVVEEVQPTPQPTPVPTPAPVEVPDVDGLGLPALGEALLSRFPFSLPRDISRIWTLLSAEPQPPKWEVDLFGGLSDRISFVGDTSFSIDLGEYPEIGQICRWASVISFCLFLALITKSMIGW